MNLAVRVYEVTANMPKEETYGLRSQIRSSATSVPSNISEGCGRGHTQELIRFVGIANGSLLELETRLEIAYRIGMIKEPAGLTEEIQVIGRMLASMKRALEIKIKKTKPNPPNDH